MKWRFATAVLGIGVVLAVSGCSSSGGWRKAGVSSAELSQAVASCTRDMPVKVYGRESRVRIYRMSDVDPACMQAKGFTRG